MLEVRVNKQRDQNMERRQRRYEKLGRTTLKPAKWTQLEILHFHDSLYIRDDKLWQQLIIFSVESVFHPMNTEDSLNWSFEQNT